MEGGLMNDPWSEESQTEGDPMSMSFGDMIRAEAAGDPEGKLAKRDAASEKLLTISKASGEFYASVIQSKKKVGKKKGGKK
jgi:hypothetical protein